MKQKQKMYRQGDVLIRQIAAFPAGERKVQADGCLAYGEVTGHAHRIADLAAAELFACGDGRYLSVGEQGVSIVHEEHDLIALEPGAYEIRIQREYSPEEIRNVRD